ncbi:hypothetical protein O163_05520 [Caldanaerobacter subterraneus subsp. yonseiensis KB-1]|uniref:Transposase n=1 Tax=Caldanaerobacter subterraneus subsp. yonseiensis KB-1 TaxID=1388761 RepID=U5CTX8_CALSX|nr:hypothetical protein O163_05520 [Caldanaerobacter subterraneus subsp. yonseiensis KB-1]
MREGKRQFKGEAWFAMDDIKREGKIVHASDAVFAAMNLKKMALWLWRKGKGPFDISKLYLLFGVLKKILSRCIQPLLSVLRKQGLKFCFVNKL